MPLPGPHDWLALHREPGQTFTAYLANRPNRPTPERHTIYVQPIGPTTEAQARVIDLVAAFLGRYFDLPVRVRPALPLSVVPRSAFRLRADGGVQMHTRTVLHDVLAPRLPRDATAYLALTAVDLYPQASWNFVFGEASLTERVGVWSLHRMGDLSSDEEHFQRALLRTLKVATHETGHMFGIVHCTAHPCDMNGSNSLDETDRAPLAPCPQCMAKIVWLTGIAPRDWLTRLAAFAGEEHLDGEATRLHATLDKLVTYSAGSRGPRRGGADRASGW
jgi:archaemetzincin